MIRLLQFSVMLWLFGMLHNHSVLASNNDQQKAVITLHIAMLEEHSDQHLFFHDLLEQSLRAIGYAPELVVHRLPQLRANMHLQTGDISILWMLESRARNQRFVPVRVGLTNGLIGHRLMLIRQGDQRRFAGITQAEDIRRQKLHTALGKNWFDVDVWQVNQLPYVVVDGNWKTMFTLLEKGRIDYLSRSVIEILQEDKEHPELIVESELMLVYDRDYYFYLSHSGKHAGAPYQQILEKALNQARVSGLMDRLIQKHWADDLQLLNYFQRRSLHLKTPE